MMPVPIPIPMLDDILGQVTSLEGVLRHHTGEGQTTLAACAELVSRCSGRIILSGMGASFFAAMPAAQALEVRGRRVLFADSSELLHFGEGSWCREDVAILVSRSGGSIESLHLAEKLRESGVRTIAVTNVPGSSLTQKTDLTLWIGSQPDELIAVQTYTGTLLALLLLVEAACTAKGNLAGQCATCWTPLQEHIKLSLEQSEQWQSFLLGNPPLYILGRGGALAAIHEGALLFHETAKSATLAMSSGQFRHGPVEVVSQSFRAIVIGTPPRTSHLDWQLATSLRAMGGDVRWLGPSASGVEDGLLMPWPANIPSALMPLFDIVPLQVAAYRMALWLGIRPGDFRYASEITANESGFPLFEANLA